VKRFFLLLALFCCGVRTAQAYRILYAEQYYRLYHLHFTQYPDDTMENIYYLEEALKADFANPLYALARIENKQEWARYRSLFVMHLRLRLVDLYLTLGSKYDKMVAYFYNAPWREENLQSLDTAEEVYRTALLYWHQAAEEARKIPRFARQLEEIQYWEDERQRIQDGELDYQDIIGAHLARLQRVREEFLRMDADTY
jgi:hypothetical protein